MASINTCNWVLVGMGESGTGSESRVLLHPPVIVTESFAAIQFGGEAEMGEGGNRQGGAVKNLPK